MKGIPKMTVPTAHIYQEPELHTKVLFNMYLRWLLGLVLVSGLPICTANAQWKNLSVSSKALKKKLKTKKIAVVVGLNQFKNPHWSKLKYAKLDAERMGKSLRDLAGFDRIIMRSQFETTTKGKLLQTFRSLKNKIKHKEDLVFVYISAHGTVVKNPKTQKYERYIIASDTSLNVAKTAISVPLLLSILKSYVSKRVVLMLATCYTGVESSKWTPNPGEKNNEEEKKRKIRRLKSRAIQILSAAGHAQSAFESVKLKSDVYTHFFLDCLRKLKQKKQRVSAVEAHVCATPPTTLFVKKHRSAVQVPKVDSEFGANRDIYLISRASSQTGYFSAPKGGTKGSRFHIYPMGGRKSGNRPLMVIDNSEMVALPKGRYRVARMSAQGQPLQEQILDIHEATTIYWKTPWRLEVQGGLLGASFAGNSPLYGGYLGIQYRIFQLHFGVWGTSHAFSDTTLPQLFFDLRPELSYTLEWGAWELEAGAFLGLGLLLQHLGAETHAGYGGIFRYGLTTTPRFWLSSTLGLGLQLDAGFSLVNLGTQWQHRFHWSARLSLQYRL